MFFNDLPRATRDWLSKPCWDGAFLMIILVGHFYGIGLGATFWVDSEAYIIVSRIFGSEQTARQFLGSSHALVYSHVMWGEGLLWYAISRLRTELIWPALIVVQHGVAIASQYIVFRALNKAWPCRIHLLLCAVMSFFPFYQSMHNALMTESLSASFLLMAIGASINILKGTGGTLTLP